MQKATNLEEFHYFAKIDKARGCSQTQAELKPTNLWPHSGMNMAGNDWWKNMHDYEELVNESYYDDLVKIITTQVQI